MGFNFPKPRKFLNLKVSLTEITLHIFRIVISVTSRPIRYFFVYPLGVLRELPKVLGRIPEGFPKKTIKKQVTDTEKVIMLCRPKIAVQAVLAFLTLLKN
jgi:hypothetical protein